MEGRRVYLQYYQLREPPFNITPDPRFLYFSEKHQEAFNHLLFGVRERKGFGPVTIKRYAPDKVGLCMVERIVEPDPATRHATEFFELRGDTNYRRVTIEEHATELSKLQCLHAIDRLVACGGDAVDILFLRSYLGG